MPKKLSAGIVLYRRREKGIEVLLVHPGGPFWSKKDDGAWSIPKGEYVEGEDPLTVAKREFYEETGTEVSGSCVALTPAKQPSGKIITAWAVGADLSGSGSCAVVRPCVGEKEASYRATRPVGRVGSAGEIIDVNVT